MLRVGAMCAALESVLMSVAVLADSTGSAMNAPFDLRNQTTFHARAHGRGPALSGDVRRER